MSSNNIAHRRNATQIPNSDWEAWKTLIQKWYLGENKTADDICHELSRRGLAVSKEQLNFRLNKKWGLFKRLSPGVWRHVDGCINERRLKSNKKSMVILAGQHIPDKTVSRETARSRGIRKYGLLEPPVPPDPNISLYICTPPGSSTDLLKGVPWPENLPWIRFCDTSLSAVIHAMQQLKTTSRSSKRSCQDPVTLSLECFAREGHKVLSKLERLHILSEICCRASWMTLDIMIKGEAMCKGLYTQNSIARLAAKLDLTLPEIYEGENLHRVSCLARCDSSEVLGEWIKIMLYLASNGFIKDWLNGAKYNLDLFVTICRLSGLIQSEPIRDLVRLAENSPTLTAVVGALFQSAVHVQATDLVAYLIDSGAAIDLKNGFGVISWPWGRMTYSKEGFTALEMAVFYNNIPLTKLLLNAGANMHSKLNIRQCLALAISNSETNHDKMIEFLLKIDHEAIGTEVKPSDKSSPLQSAIIWGDEAAFDALAISLPDFNYVWDKLIYFPFPRGQFKFLLEGISSLGVAASYPVNSEYQLYFHQYDWHKFPADEQKAFQLSQKIIESSCEGAELSDRTRVEGLIAAAARGYTTIISLIVETTSAQINATCGSLSPLCAAIFGQQTRACQQLLQLGACTNTRKLWSCVDESGISCPTIMHLAVCYGSPEIVRLLINHGVSMDQACTIGLTTDGITWPRQHSSERLIKTSEMTPFQLAVYSKQWKTARVIADLKDQMSTSELISAAETGQLDLVKLLIGKGWHPNTACQGAVSPYEAASRHEHGEVAGYFVTLGAEMTRPIPLSVWKTHDTKILKQLLQSQHHTDCITIGRDQEGRSYLENAVLSHDAAVIGLALSLDTTAYDSGAFCAVISMFGQDSLPGTHYILKEFLWRRNHGLLSGSNSIDPTLEATAISLAAFFMRLDIVKLILKDQPPELLTQMATIPDREELFHSFGPEYVLKGTARAFCRERPGMAASANQWHNPIYSGVSPLLYPMGPGGNLEILNVLLNASYQGDGFVLRTAVLRQLPPALFETLVERSNDIDATKSVHFFQSNESPLHLTTGLGYIKMCQILLNHGADVDVLRLYNQTYCTPITLAIASHRFLLIDTLVEAGAKLNYPPWSPNKAYWTPLQAAVEGGVIGIVRRLLLLGADANARRNVGPVYGCEWGLDSRTMTAIEVAAARGRLDIVQLLLDSGLSTQGKGRISCLLAIHFARKRDFRSIEGLIMRYVGYSDEDDKILKHIVSTCPEDFNGSFLHPKEFSSHELIEAISELDDSKLNGEIEITWLGPWQPKLWHKRLSVLVVTTTREVATKSALSQPDALKHCAEIIERSIQESTATRLSYLFDNVLDREGVAQEAERIASQALRDWAMNHEVVSQSMPSDLDELVSIEYSADEDCWHEGWNREANEGIATGEVDENITSLELVPDNCSENFQWTCVVEEEGEQPGKSVSSQVPTQQENREDGVIDEDWEGLRVKAIQNEMRGEPECPFVPCVWAP